MKMMRRNGVALAYEEVGTGTPPIVLIHGFGCDHSFFSPQMEFFSQSHRVVAVDLRGHGRSDAPRQDYSIVGFAADVAWQCAHLGIEKPMVIGHSMGGLIALELAARYSGLPAAIVLIDSVVLPPASFVDSLRPLDRALRGRDYRRALHEFFSSAFLATDDPARKARLLATMFRTEQHVLASAFSNHIIEYDAEDAARGCRVPTAYIGAVVPMAALVRFHAACPQLITGQTLGSGHFSPLEVPDQINAMLSRFISICMRADRVSPSRGSTSDPGLLARALWSEAGSQPPARGPLEGKPV